MLIAATGGYLAGTIPSADIAARLAPGGTVDLRAAGSNNPGALNAAQQLGPRWGIAVLVAGLDSLVLSLCAVCGRVVVVWDRPEMLVVAAIRGSSR